MHSGTLFRQLLQRKEPLILPGVFNPLAALAAQKAGFEALYLSGGALSASLGFPDIGLLTLTQLADQARAIASAAPLPLLVDADTGFGEAANVHKTVQTLESSGVAGCHLEDQKMPKRCGHLEGKELIPVDAMVEKIRAAVAGRKDLGFFVMARTDARGPEGLEAAIRRGEKYREAGADGLFPEGLESEEEFQTFAKAFPKFPLLANMTEFGKSPLIPAKRLGEMGYRMVLFPVTTLRLAMKAVTEGLEALKKEGSQTALIQIMQTRKELYELLDYEGYVQLDRRLKFQ